MIHTVYLSSIGIHYIVTVHTVFCQLMSLRNTVQSTAMSSYLKDWVSFCFNGLLVFLASQWNAQFLWREDFHVSGLLHRNILNITLYFYNEDIYQLGKCHLYLSNEKMYLCLLFVIKIFECGMFIVVMWHSREKKISSIFFLTLSATHAIPSQFT